MPELNDAAYYAARAARAFELAKVSNDPEMAAIHRRMAVSYAELAELMRPRGRELRVERG